MNKIKNRAFVVLLLALLLIVGLLIYTMRFLDHGREWALTFARANSSSTGVLTDRNGLLLASFDASENRFAEDEATRISCFHVTGDYWGRTGSGALSLIWGDMYGYSPLTGTTHARSSDIQLTIDAGLCRTAYAALGGQKGAVLLLDYRSGELLCMVSSPSIDPLAEGEVPEGAYINRCLSASFTPGSIFKLVTAAAAIETLPDIHERSFNCNGVYTCAGVDIRCAGVHGAQSFEQALSNSCNVAFAQIAILVGHERMIERVRDYGLIDAHSLDGLPTAAGNYPLEFIGDPELGWSGVGQSTDLVNPFAMLRLVAAIANGGELVAPHMLLDKTPSVERLMPASTAEELKAMMNYNVVDHYDGDNNFPGLRLCAKTGTAEQGEGSPHAWFVGFLADDAHPYAFVVLVENGGGGLRVAGPVANMLLQRAVGNG